jgi:NADPH:quinone reductase-like Zn-dependent oxidoreductase
MLVTHLKQKNRVRAATTVSLDDIPRLELFKETICISLVEVEKEFLATMNQRDMDNLRSITDRSDNILWLTGADMLGKCPNPSLTLSSGLSRALMLEQPSVRFSVLDTGPIRTEELDTALTCENIIAALNSSTGMSDTEFIQKDGLLYISRFGPDFSANELFRRRVEHCGVTDKVPLQTARPAQISIEKVGVSETIHFQQISEPAIAPPNGYVDILVKSVSLNAKDIYALNGRVETQQATRALEFSGVVTAVGPDVEVMSGDRVVALMPFNVSTTARVPARLVHKLLPGEQFGVVPTILLAYATALYALRDRAHLRAGESVLIHSGTGAVGLAAIAIAQRLGATVYTTVGSEAKRNFLVTEYGVPHANIFHSRNRSFVTGIKSATDGRGVDVIVNALVGDMMHETWDCIATFGRFVEIGKKELLDAGKLDMRVFSRNATFTAFDLSDMVYHENPHHRNLFVK